MKFQIQFMKLRGVFFVVSFGAILLALLSVFVLRGFNLGIDFTGGLTANLTINFEESDIQMLRDAFAEVELEQRQEDGSTAVITESFGGNISQLESVKAVDYPTATYLIRIRHIDGVEQEEVESVLHAVLNEKFPQRTVAAFSVSGPDASEEAL